DRAKLQRPRRRTFEVHAADVIARAVARTFELLLAGEPVGDAAEVRAAGAERDEFLFRRREVNEPEGVRRRLVLLVHSAGGKIVRLADAVNFLRLLQDFRAEEILEHRAERQADEREN